MKRSSWIPVLFLLSFKIGHSSDFQSVRTIALGGAGHAAPFMNDVIYMNPSYGAFLPSYSLSANYLTYRAGTPLTEGVTPYGRTYNVSIQDSRTDFFQAGLGYTRHEDRSVVSMGAGRVMAERWGIGLGGKLLLPDTRFQMAHDLMFSTTLLVSKALIMSFIVDNLLETREGLRRGLYRTYLVGTKYTGLQIVNLFFDPHWSAHFDAGKQFGWRSGVEFALLGDFFLRGGMYRNAPVPHLNLRGNGFGMGLAWVAPKISFEYAFSRFTSGDREGAEFPGVTGHVFGTTLYF